MEARKLRRAQESGGWMMEAELTDSDLYSQQGNGFASPR